MKYFLVVFNRGDQTILSIDEFVDADVAVRERFKREASDPRPDLEVVVLGAESQEALHQTHSRYFGGRRELTEVS